MNGGAADPEVLARSGVNEKFSPAPLNTPAYPQTPSRSRRRIARRDRRAASTSRRSSRSPGEVPVQCESTRGATSPFEIAAMNRPKVDAETGHVGGVRNAWQQMFGEDHHPADRRDDADLRAKVDVRVSRG